MDEEAKNIIKDHKNPLNKMTLIGKKFFLKDCSLEAQEQITKNLGNLEKVLKHQKVEKRCGRARAEWQPSLYLAQVNKVVKGLLEHFGYQDKTGIYMYPEEMLFLVETNRMEVLLNNIPLSIQECYDLVLNLPEFNLNKYRVYKKLIMQGYRVIRSSEIARRKVTKKNDENECCNNKKRKLDTEIVDVGSKKAKNKSHESPQNASQNKTKDNEKETEKESNSKEKYELMKKELNEFYEERRKHAPQSYTPNSKKIHVPDYYLFNSNNSSRTKWDYNLFICKNDVSKELKTDNPSIYAICSGDNISFFKIGAVNIPCNIYN